MIQASWMGNGPIYVVGLIHRQLPTSVVEILFALVHLNAMYQFMVKAGAVMLEHGSRVAANMEDYYAADAFIIVLDAAFYALFWFWTHQEFGDLCTRVSQLKKKLA